MGFILGFLMGFVGAIGLIVFLTIWLCSRSSNVAVAKFISGIAQALAQKPHASATTSAASEGEDEGREDWLNGTAKKSGGVKS